MKREEAIDTVKLYWPIDEGGPVLREAIETLIPELKESEDERIRKSLIKAYTNKHPCNFPTVDGFTREQILAWFEKQGKQKPAWSEHDEKMIGRIRGIIERYAITQSAVDVNGDLCEQEFIEYDEWLKSLKDKMQLQNTTNEPGEIKFDSSYSNTITLPGCKKDIHTQIRQWLFDLINSFIWRKDWAVGKADCLSWIASQQKPVRWSEEDESNRQETLYFIREFQKSDKCKDEGDMQNSVTCERWLESLMPQNHWKPTEQQLYDLEFIMMHYPNIRDMVEPIYYELKKL